MASRPPGGPSHSENLIDFDDHQPTHNAGAPPRPAAHDEGRPSVSYDDFVGGARSTTAGLPGGPGAPGGATTPYLGGANNNSRAYSQTSDLHNYQRYSDADIPHDDDASTQGYYAAGGAYDQPSPSLQRGNSKNAHNRNSILSLGGGLTGRVKNMFGRGNEYSEMDLPLTENAAHQRQPSGNETASQHDDGHSAKPKKGLGTFKFGFGRGTPDPSTLGPRIIHLNNPPANAVNKYVDNHISTCKYNIVTFLPKFLYEQFSKYANLFFLFTAILQQIPGISPTSRFTTIVPLGIVLLVSAVKEYIEDYRRKQSDSELNNSKAQVLKGSTFTDTKWVNVAVGDIVRVESEQPFPTDLVLLASSEPEGLCYIETANLDGETNLKIKQAIPETADYVSPAELARLGGRIRSEQPNSSLYTYEATLTIAAGGGEKELPLAPDQLLLRGATLRNTPWIHGVVVFTGHETKLMRNATATPIKTTAVERMVNKQILMLVLILIALSIISSIGDVIIQTTQRDSLVDYLRLDRFNGAKQFFRDLLTYWVLYSNLVPISLFVTIEIVKYYTGSLIDSDLDIYYEPTDTPAKCRTSSLVEELGQIEYIFSDKTGTLTCNMMEFKQSTIAGIQYADEVPEDRRGTIEDGVEVGIHDFKQLEQNRKTHHNKYIIDQFLTLLATCHTVIPERKGEKAAIKYQAASPDEGALVEGAVTLGYKFTARKPRAVIIEVDGRELEYELLAVCEFNSTRKRMSTIFRTPEGKIVCYTKGADTVILERLGKDNPHVEATLTHLEEYASEGLRTLCLAMREIGEDEFREWWTIFNTAQTTVGGNRADELDKAAELIEHDMTLLGATAIEDKLQDGVPDTIATLQSAGIKVWVLTGDRQETAINIGMIVKLVKRHLKSILLAIGDGANDVSMIQAAHVGVGISGVEGLQAARSADIAIGQFRYLRKLLLVHGAWSYQRVSKVILYSFYKNIAMFMTQFWYSFQNGFSGQIIYESWTLTMYNVFFTAAPPFVLGIFDQFVSARLLDRYPQLYRLSQSGVFFRMHSFWSWVGNGFYHSLILYFGTQAFVLWDWPQWDGRNAGHWVWGTAAYTANLATVLLKASLITNIWTKYTVLAIPGSMLLWFILMPLYATVAPMINISNEYVGVIARLFPDPRFWAMIVVLPPLCLIRDFAWKYAKRMYFPQSYHHVQEIQKYNIQDYRPRMEQFQKAIRKVRQVQRMRKQRGYAFSQTDESQARVLQAYDTTQQRGRYGEMASSRK
ncbi:plasma membrane calcium-transporting ATPase 4 [Pyrenophora tritici-repentis Pt-1C-BFP]|uniref:Phospholipid-transporting ATPase n=1 Tax=Pyrenophora tritici-repentis (strain Pt-1C-BFP) TaxID=426418 RepID=B2WI33_PYRTR|nr:plasma membrane calcium-transporting ATPase 4 [Pyrenophora tritici-repentis Pt-1C-BFP]EDU42693.1 plasma membrane calcium-transporting ATPase 4 [Pyrenophora tritici-repentis Pt-1C-BFP]